MTTIASYNAAPRHFMNKGAATMTLRMMLLNNSATFNAAHTGVSQVSNAGAYQVSGNGWTAGGVTLTGVTVTTVTTNDAIITAANISVNASGGTIGPAYKAVIYDDSDTTGPDIPLFFIDFEGAKQAETGTPFQFQFSADGLVKINA